jgi:hypothetical protein
MDFLPARRHFGPGDTVPVKEAEEAVKSLHEDGSVVASTGWIFLWAMK